MLELTKDRGEEQFGELADELEQLDAADTIRALIADEARINALAIAPRAEADRLYFALPEDERRRLGRMGERGLPDRMGKLYAEAEELDAKAGELFDRIATARATTIDDVIAQIEFLMGSGLHVEKAYVETVIGGLRCIQTRRLGEPRDDQLNRAVDDPPEIVGFGEPD